MPGRMWETCPTIPRRRPRHSEVIPTFPNLMDALRIVLRASRSTAKPPGEMPEGSHVPVFEPAMLNEAEQPPIRNFACTPIAIRHSGSWMAFRRAKPASALRPGNAIRLETGERVVITYVSVGFEPTDRYIEWRGPATSNWTNVPFDAQVMLALVYHFQFSIGRRSVGSIAGALGSLHAAYPLR